MASGSGSYENTWGHAGGEGRAKRVLFLVFCVVGGFCGFSNGGIIILLLFVVRGCVLCGFLVGLLCGGCCLFWVLCVGFVLGLFLGSWLFGSRCWGFLVGRFLGCCLGCLRCLCCCCFV